MKLNIEKEDWTKTGVYKITNLINNKFYIGSTSNSFYNRYHQHISDYKLDKKSIKILYRAFDKYGFENFINNNFKFMQFLSENHDDFISELLINNNFNTNYKKFFNKIINEYDSENNISIGSHNKSKGNVLPVDLITFFQNINLLFKSINLWL